MKSEEFTTDSLRDVTFDLLSGIANDPTRFDELTNAYLSKIHERADGDELRRYTREIYNKILGQWSMLFRKLRMVFLNVCIV